MSQMLCFNLTFREKLEAFEKALGICYPFFELIRILLLLVYVCFLYVNDACGQDFYFGGVTS